MYIDAKNIYMYSYTSMYVYIKPYMYVSSTLTYIVWDRDGALKAVRINAHSRAITARSWLTHK